jgi:hypothetical protein
MINWKGFGRKWSWLNQGTDLVICPDGLRKPTKPQVRTAAIPAKI